MREIAILGNLFFIFWLLANGIDKGFGGTILEVVSSFGLMVLLLVNVLVLYPHKK